MTRAHALLSASGAHRWLTCTPSAKLEDTLPDTSSEAAHKGSHAHEIAELKLRKYFIEPMGPRKFANAMKKFKENELYEADMDRNTDLYLEYVQSVVHGFETKPYITIERKVDFSNYVPGGFGTSDCIVIGAKILHVIDYKNGQGHPVSAEDNAQMKLYALGALNAYSLLYDIETVCMSIVQPKVWDEPSFWEMSKTDLLAWGESIKPIAERASKGEGEYVVGEHCGFCRAKDTCRARVDQYFGAAKIAPLKPPLISWEEVGEVLKKAEGIVGWYNSLKESALARVLAGGEVSGWKAVEGRGSRQYADTDKAFEHLKASGIDEAILYVREPLTPPALEKELGKKQYKELLEVPGHVIKKPGAPALAPENDKRPALNSAAAVFGDNKE
ncbi:hypothetical protein HMPREF0322_00426 [Desulfitobacterium hafniense DP7]|uniref:PD-(D/E)XK endonuclease-like domain-containing protein n=1 Tax=Desulfitobacterium hafniense DP7 TaxID=537010 RepID=G9XHK1_DESHA|nr:DUF2800 domain-containing protein [Desulfitobacterium hafniense]EHL08784.1 hypothetical protein HMPREF0322_00426 [Desulfitobacterium hafniense DP7]